MQNEPWEPCPRCGGKSVEVSAESFKSLAWISVVVCGACVLGAVVIVEIFDLDSDGPRWLRFAPAAVPGICFVAALWNAIRTTLENKVFYHGKCRSCSYEWDIGEEHSPVLSDTTQDQ